MSKTNIDEVKLGGAKRKNGHKFNCTCHICENMNNKAKRGGYAEELEKKVEYAKGGSTKKNGHRKDCKCPICKNMNNSKKNKKGGKRRTRKMRGGDDDEVSDEEIPYTDSDSDSDSDSESDSGINEDIKGGKKSNGHKTNCTCPICKNMKKANKRGGNDFKKAVEEQFDFEGGKHKKKSNGHKSDCTCPICKNMRKKGGQEPTNIEPSVAETDATETKATDEEYDALESIGGTRKHKKRVRGSKTRRAKRSRRRH
jgi:hypothetical protein